MLFTIKNSVKNRTTLLPFFLLLFCLSLALLTAACGKQEGSAGHLYSFKDAQGTEIKLKEKPKRILTLSMGTDEIMLGLVEPERMLAVQALLDDPKSSTVLPLVKNIPQRITAPTLEQLVAMRPDLIIAPDWGHLENVAAMRDAGLTVAVCKGPRNLAQIKETIELLAKAAGEEERGKKLLALMDKELAEVKAQTEKIPPAERKRVVLISLMGSYGGKGSTFDEACSLANVINARAEIGIKDGQPMTKEQLIQANPDMLFLPTYDNNGKYDLQAFRSRYLDDPSLSVMKAVQEKQFREPFEGYIYSCSQDFVFAVREVAYMAYGDAFKQPKGKHLSAVQ